MASIRLDGPNRYESKQGDNEVLKFLGPFIKAHPRLSPEREEWLIKHFRYAYDVRDQLFEEQERVIALIATGERGTEQLKLHEELDDIKDVLDNNAEIKKIDFYRNTLIEHNLKLIIKIAMFYSAQSTLPLEDLIQEGTFGFIRAIEKFNPHAGVKLSTYSTWWIRQKITRAMSNKGRLIKLPVYVVSAITKIINVTRQLSTNTEYPQFSELTLESIYVKDMPEEVYAELLAILVVETRLPEAKVTKLITLMSKGFQTIANFSEPEDGEKYHQSELALIDPHLESKMIKKIDTENLKENLNLMLETLTPLSQSVLKIKYGWGEEYSRSSYKGLKEDLTEEGSWPTGKRVTPQLLVSRAWVEVLANYL